MRSNKAHEFNALKNKSKKKSKNMLDGFRHAFRGVAHCFRSERNFVAHLCMAVIVVYVGRLAALSPTEWTLAVLMIAAVLCAELLNTASERIVDLISPHYHALAKHAKDLAAGGVLAISLGAAVGGVLLFWPKRGAILDALQPLNALYPLFCILLILLAREWARRGEPREGGKTPMAPITADAENRKLIARAKAAMEKAYAPYSSFKVGAALRTMDGTVYSGCNVENVSFGGACCAERVALFKAVSEGAAGFDRIAIVSDGAGFTMPCGICRQALAEFAPDLIVVVVNEKDDARAYRLADLLPHGFENGFDKKQGDKK